jgi:hypothetical protein
MLDRNGFQMARPRSLVGLCLAVVAVALASGPSVRAQSDGASVYDPTLRRGNIFQLFSQPRPANIQEVPAAKPPARRTLRADAERRAAEQRPAALPKVDPVTFVVVIGDTLGDLLAGGLDESLADAPAATVVRRTRADSGLVRSDFHDWPRAVRDLLASGQPVTAAVMLVGANDRQPIREGETVHEPLSERWRELYRERIDAIAQAFADRRIPLIWVGAPPMQNARLANDLIAINELFRQRVERLGGTYVDLWPAFVDSENRFSISGPDLNGQVARLRTGDGVHFTRAGARKAAHFVDVALRRLIPDMAAPPLTPLMPAPAIARPDGQTPPALVTPEDPARMAERIIDESARASLGHDRGFGAVSPPDIRVKPPIGPTLALTATPASANAALLRSVDAARGVGASARELDRTFGEGALRPPVTGRADDFRWPPPSP